MTTVKLPNGGTAQFPDDMAPADIERVLQQQFGGSQAPAAKPGSREYADWARDQAMAGNALPQVSDAPPEWEKPNAAKSVLPGPLGAVQDFSNAAQSGFNQGLTFGFGDELYAGATAPFRALGPMAQGQGYDIGKAYEHGLETARGTNADQAALNPVAAAGGEMAGLLVNPASRWASGIKVGSTIGKVGLAAAEGATVGGAYGFGKGDTMDERLSGAGIGAATGGVLGAAVPAVAGAVGKGLTNAAQRNATSAAIKGAPSADDLRAASSQLFQKVDQSGVTVDTNKFGQFVQGLVTSAKRDRINPTLDPKATAAYQEMIQALADVQAGSPMTVSQLHTLRQIAQKAATSAEGRDAMFANRIVDGLDNFVTSPGSTVMPPNRLGQGNKAGNDLLDAISTWGRSRRVGLIEEAIYRAGNQASGLENGLRVQFRQLLQNKKTRSLFSKAEIQAIEEVANGTTLSNAMRLLGKFGFGGGSASNMLGGTIGFGAGSVLGGPVGGVLAAGIGTGARKVGEAMARGGAERAAQVVATPNIPTIAAGPKTLAAQEFLKRLGLSGGAVAVQGR